MKKGGGRRYFRPEDISLLHGIKVFLYEKEYTIKDLQEFLRVKGPGKVIAAGDVTSPVKPSPVSKPATLAPELKPEPGKAAVAATVPEEQEIPDVPQDDQQSGTLLDALSRLQGAREKLDAALKKG